MFGSAMPFDPAGESADLFLDMFWRGIEHILLEDEDDYFDEDRLKVPVNPDPRFLHGFAIHFPKQSRLVAGMKPPNFEISAGDESAAMWLIPPIDAHAIHSETGKPRQLNLLRMIRSAYRGHLKGAVLEEFPNPFAHGHGKVRTDIFTLNDMRTALHEADNWKYTQAPEFVAAGGSSTSDEKRRSARANAIAARRAKTEKQRANDEKIAVAIERGFTTDQVAEQLKKDPRTIVAAVRRHQGRHAG